MSDALTVSTKAEARASSFWRKGRRWHDFTLATLILVTALIGLSAFRIGQVNGMRRAMAQQEPRLVRLESELQKYQVAVRQEPVAAVAPPTGMSVEQYQVLLRDLRAELVNQVDAVPIGVARAAAASFVPILAFDQEGNKLIEGTAASLGKGYFLTVKHVVTRVSDQGNEVAAVSLRIGTTLESVDVVDMGKGMGPAVFADDWAVVRTTHPVEVPAIEVDPAFSFDLATRVVRIGNDYSNGIVVSDGIIGTRQADGLVSCLTDGHKGSSGGGIIDARGVHVGIPIGRMNEDHRYSFIQPLSKRMFRKVPHLR